MNQVVIENPVLNSPYSVPQRHFRFTDEGITNDVIEARRTSAYFMPVAQSRNRSRQQMVFETEWTRDRLEENWLVNRIRERVGLWRQGGYAGVTSTTRRLLDYWTNPDRERKLFFCQIEALETAIYITEAARKYGDGWIENALREANSTSNPDLSRIAFKMATGAGKTVVMALLIAYHALNKMASPQNARFSDTFLIITPGITIRDRLRVLLPNDPENYYRQRDILPSHYLDKLGQAGVVITNFHAFRRREKIPGRLTKTILKEESNGAFTETSGEMVRRVCRELGNKKNIIVINDEAHHCYRRRSDDEHSAETKLYSRDPSLDPQLVWKGKDEQDAKDLAVPVVPIYIQEKIHPQAIIEDFRRTYAEGVAEEQPAYQFNLFNDFNGLEDDDFARKLDFYSHDTESQPHWSNRLILGDSLLVMNSLAEKERLKGRVQMIYIDPPYGIKFGSNWQVSTRKHSVRDGRAEDITRQPEQIRAFRDTWQLGIHSYLSYLRDRLITARELLTETGSIFVQIGDENMHLVRCLMDEVFGSENFINLITVIKRSPQPDDFLSSVTDYLFWYGKIREHTKFRPVFKDRPLSKDKRAFTTSDLTSSHFYESPNFEYHGRTFTPGRRYWSTSIEGLKRLERSDRIVISRNTIRYKRYEEDFPVMLIGNNWPDVALSSFGDNKIYIVQTSTKVIQRCLLMTTDPGDLVLDPTCGSGTTAVVAEQWGRRWITIDTSRVALALARTRLMSARYPYYLLADSPEGRKKETDLMGQDPPDYPTENDIKKGFVYKRVPHITLKFIANNPDIDVIHERWQKELDPLREEINDLAEKNYREWEIPHEVKREFQALKEAIADWWDIKKERQTESDRAIARDADGETLYDQPYEDNKRGRVTGPFTVESLSPHRVLVADENMNGTVSEQEARKQQDFTSVILENMYKAGVQNTRKDERLKFDRLEPYAGTWIHAEGDYTDADGQSRRVAVSIGPEHGTVGPLQVKEAAKEAVQGLGYDLLVVGGFAFDPHVSEESKRYGTLTVLPTRMNPDLAMGDELLKKTGAGNLFMIFGEPDIALHPQDDGKLSVELLGVDVYDPTTGALRCNSTDEVACWFIDTEYNGESFFVRHAYFTGADRPYDKLKRALRSEIDEDAWSDLYTTHSRPFDLPDSGKIAVKVINHYGDEVLKVYDIDLEKNKTRMDKLS